MQKIIKECYVPPSKKIQTESLYEEGHQKTELIYLKIVYLFLHV